MFTFDARNATLASEDEESGYEPEIREQWRTNRLVILGELAGQFGSQDLAQKVSDFRALGSMPFSVSALHNTFLRQIRDAFTGGAYYPALVGAGALGERILNQLIIVLRSDYQDHPATTPEIAGWKSFTNWKQCIAALAEWGVFTDELVENYRKLNQLRNRAVHYNAGLDNTDARDAALKAILAVQDIIAEMFQALGGPPRFIAGTSGHAFISSDAEKQPLIRRFYLPSSVLVSPTFKMEFSRPSPDTLAVQVFDDETYHHRFLTLTDEEFAHHRTDPERFQLATPASD
ncbi:hypothetical protein [Nocardia salmonicida]|uniref:hypothetical protein n=1 Tax=Nocardia salmonicida TaxID=53431 RepID=UPI003401D5F9